jgi:hypothetical protein
VHVAQWFRRLTLLCLLGVGAIATLIYTDLFNAKVATLAIARVALLLFVFDTLADEPAEMPAAEAEISRLMAFKVLASETRKGEQPADACGYAKRQVFLLHLSNFVNL